ncbi:hypothetical protein B481_3202 [Planococcus halocryophilus Or1]|nr:hypothetical protein B481_3202 [Planococcus halocryophilus Or1]
MINTSWEPIGTDQKGEHVSVYQKDSQDWNEKVKAVSYATGLDANDMYVMMIKMAEALKSQSLLCSLKTNQKNTVST